MPKKTPRSTNQRPEVRKFPRIPKGVAFVAAIGFILILVGVLENGSPTAYFPAPAAATGLPVVTTSTKVAQSDGPLDSKWETYQDGEYGFSIRYPSGWYYFRPGAAYDAAGGNFVLFSSTLGNTSPQVRGKDEDARLTVSVLSNESKMDVGTWLAGSPLLEEAVSKPTINGLDGIRVSTSELAGDDPRQYISLFLATPTRRYSLIGVASMSHDTVAFRDTIIRMQDSFTALAIENDGEAIVPLNTDSAWMRVRDGAIMLYVPEGEFVMGSDDGDSDEQPVHKVHLDGFFADQYEVTNARYQSCVEAGACPPPWQSTSLTRGGYFGDPQFGSFPVISVDWDMASAYCEWVGAQLPTEAQWEKAARGTDARTYPWGEDIDKTRANYERNLADTISVGIYESGRSPYGLYDMAGNVWEWVADWYDSDYYQNSPYSNPPGPEGGEWHVLRGGAWNYGAYDLRVSLRYGLGPSSFHSSNVGFRCVLSR